MQKFNGSLIRQFPSLTTGNAAAGVQVSVFISGTNTLATLYATNNTAGAQLSNPLPTDSKGFYAFFAVDGRYRLEFNNGFPALEIQLVDVIDINTEFNAAISGLQDTVDTLTITVAGDFDTGATVTARNQVVLWPVSAGGDGREYRWAGALPKTVPPASTPASTGGISDSAWVYTANVAFEQALASVSSAKLVGGVPASILSLLARSAKTPEDYGAVGDAVMVAGVVSGTDDTAAIQAWLDGGGPYALRKMCNYRLTAEINMPANPIVIVGLGRLPVYPYFFPNFGATGNLPTFMVDHNGSDGFRFSQNSSARGSYLYGFNVIRATASTCIRAFGFNVAGSAEIPHNYGYDTTIDRVGIFDFVSAIDLYDSSGVAPEPTMADITIRDCAINRNDYISRTLNGTAWNGFKFYDNKAGQQKTGGIDVQAHNFIEHGNFLEGMANPVKVSGAYKGCTVGGSYFEANAQPGGIYLYNLQAVRGPTKINTFSIVASNEGIIPVLGNNISNVISDSPAVIEAGYNCTYPEITGSISSLPELDPLSFGISSVNSPRPIFKDAPPLFKTVGLYRATTNKERGVNPFDGRAMVVEDLTTDAIATSRTVSITAAANDYLTLSFMLRHEDATVAKTYITVDVSGQAVGTRDYSFDDEVLHIRQGGWNVYTVTIRPQAPISTVTLRVYPYGVGAAAGLPFKLSGISAYASDTVNSTQPWVNQDALNTVTVDPATGTWVVGDTFRNVNAAAGGQGTFLYIGSGWVYS